MRFIGKGKRLEQSIQECVTVHFSRSSENLLEHSKKSWVLYLFFSCSLLSDSLWPHRLQHTRLLCPSPSPRTYSSTLSQWCHPTISSSVIPSSSCFQSFPISEPFPMSQPFASVAKLLELSTSSSNEYSGFISFRMDWLDLLAVQGTLKSLPQHHSSKASILQCSAFFMFQLSQPYMTTRKTIALTRFKVTSLLLNMLCRLVIAFLPKSRSLLISWLQSPSAVVLAPKKIKSVTVSIVSLSIFHEVIGPDAMIFVVLNVEF